MHWSVASANYLEGYRLAATHFQGGGPGPALAGVFARLADLNPFRQLSINPVAQPSLRD